MKIRITRNSIRFRLLKPEVLQFEKTGWVVEAIAFGPGAQDQLEFSLKKLDGDQITLEKGRSSIMLGVPLLLADEWTTTEKVGMEGSVETHEGHRIFVLIEKDFACLNAEEADNEGTYPNPLANI
jgi:hypothetical protein